MMPANLILNIDSYKASHYLQYPKNAEYISAYIEARGGAFKKLMFFGLQAFLKEYLTKPISMTDIEEAEDFFKLHGLPFNKQGWLHIYNKHGGFLPLKIEAVAEGEVLPVNNVLLQVVNTDPKCLWLTCYVETALLRGVWYPTTVATLSFHCKSIIKKFLVETSENTEDNDFKLHDFGARSATSLDSAALGGMAHLVNFRGSDTIAGIVAARRYYDAEMAGYSIPAADHSTITAWGVEDELEAYRNMLNQFSKDNVIAVVSDSYNILEALDKLWGEQFKQEIENFGGKVIIRLDSGNPVQSVPEAIEILMSKFGYTINSKGYKVLPSYIRVIQGDGISIGSIEKILIAMKSMQQSAENVAFGMGSALLQKVDRDTMSFAMKASAIYNSGIWHDMYKNPKFDPDKRSKAGRFALVTNQDGTVETIKLEYLGKRENMLKVVFENGALLNDVSFDSIRNSPYAKLTKAV